MRRSAWTGCPHCGSPLMRDLYTRMHHCTAAPKDCPQARVNLTQEQLDLIRETDQNDNTP